MKVKVKFKVRFMDYRKGDTAELDTATAKRYVEHFQVASFIKPSTPRKKQQKAAPKTKMVLDAANK